jgi:predicted enzyme related to lactoylglutathione lyase
MTPDPKAAAEFYSKVIGYSVQTHDMPSGPYHMLMDGSTPRAGIMSLPEPGIPPNWSFYVTVDDVDAIVDTAKGRGAEQAWPLTDVPDVGRMTGFIDPHGAYFSVIQYSYGDMEGAPEFESFFVSHGAFSWFELRSQNVAAARDFYTALFRWNIEDTPVAGITYPVIKVGGTGVGGMIPPPAPGIPSHWAGFITVNDADQTAEAARSAGGSILASMDMPEVGRIHVIQDPQGANVSVITYVSG